jgi:hypothetical protein
MPLIKLHNKTLYSMCNSLSTAASIRPSLIPKMMPNGSKRDKWENEQ